MPIVEGVKLVVAARHEFTNSCRKDPESVQGPTLLILGTEICRGIQNTIVLLGKNTIAEDEHDPAAVLEISSQETRLIGCELGNIA